MSKKKSYEEIKEFYKSKGYELIDIEYVNNSTKMSCIDNESYRLSIRYSDLQNGYIPNRFDKSNPYTIENIKLYINLNRENVELISAEYTGTDKKLVFKCLIHNEEFNMSWHSFQQGQGCKKCGIELMKDRQSLSIEIIRQRFADMNRNDVELVSNKYISVDSKLIFKCLKHNEYFNMNWSNFQGGQSCKKCRIEKIRDKRSLLMEEVRQRFADMNRNDVELVSNKYINSREKLIFKCLIHNEEFNMSWSNFRSGQGCAKCGIEKNSGENSNMWNPNITQEERETKRNYLEYVIFIKEALFLSNYTCDITGARGCELEVHHLNGYHWFVEGRTDFGNVVVLSKEIHKKFHKEYGVKNNTKEQYIEFKEKCKNKDV